MLRRKYIGEIIPPPAGNFEVVHADTKKVVAVNRTYDDAALIASAWNHLYCQPNKPNKYFPKLQIKQNETVIENSVNA